MVLEEEDIFDHCYPTQISLDISESLSRASGALSPRKLCYNGHARKLAQSEEPSIRPIESASCSGLLFSPPYHPFVLGLISFVIGQLYLVPQIRSSSYLILLAQASRNGSSLLGIFRKKRSSTLNMRLLWITYTRSSMRWGVFSVLFTSVRFFCTKTRGRPSRPEAKGSLNKDVINLQGLSCFLGMGDLNILNPTRSRTTGEPKAVTVHFISVRRCRSRANARWQLTKQAFSVLGVYFL